MCEDYYRLDTKQVLLLSNRNITVKPFLYGEDYYIHAVISELEKRGIPVKMKVINRCNRVKNPPYPEVDKNTLVILHNVSPIHVCKLKMRKKFRVLMPVYFLWNRAASPLSNLRTIFGSVFWQFVVDEYLVPSPNLAEKLKKLGVVRKIRILPPKYSCPFCHQKDNLKKMELLKAELPNVVKAVYIGFINHKRFPLRKIIEKLNRDLKRKYELTIYTASPVREKTYCKGNVEVRIVRTKLSEKEKCKVLRESHIYIAPEKGTTMEPSISVIEAEYHGNIIARF